MNPPDTDPKLPLVIGIAGHRHLPGGKDLEKIEATVRSVFRAFSSKRSSGKDELGKMRKRLGFPGKTIRDGLPVETPVWILSSMAQGADILCSVLADEVYRVEDGGRSIRFMAPLATPWKHRQKHEKPVDSKYHAHCDGFIWIRGVSIGNKGETPPADPDYEEFVLPLGGRGTLQSKTTFPAEKKYLTLENLTADEIQEQIKLIPGGLNAHHRASAHYVALYSHVLVALWDGNLREESSVGTDAAVRAKISGPAPGQISEAGLFNWADAGPVLQVFARNENEEDVAEIVGEPLPNALRENAETRNWAVIHPDDCEPAEKHGKSRDDHGKDLFGHVLKSMNRLNRETIQDMPDSWFEPQVGDRFASETASEDEEINLRSIIKLRSIWGKAARLSQYSRTLKDRVENCFALLFLLVALAALQFDVYAHWYDHSDHGELVPQPLHHTWLLELFVGVVFISIALFALFLYKPKVEARFSEYRAMAEAARIQLSWMIAGIPQSVPLHYLQRHRGAFDYIRDGVSSWCFPYENAQRWFDSLSDKKKRIRLEYVVKNWVRDQEGFFRSNTKFQEHMHHLLHTLGMATALVGFSAATFLAATGYSAPLDHSVAVSAAEKGFLAGMLAGSVALILFLNPSRQKAHGKIAKVLGVLKWAGLVIALLAPPLAGWFLPKECPIAPAHPREFWPFDIISLIFVIFGIVFFCFAVRQFFPQSKTASKVLPFLPFALCAITFCLLAWATIHHPAHPDSATNVEAHGAGAIEDNHLSPPQGRGTGNGRKSGRQNAEVLATLQFPYILVIGIPLLFGALLVAWGEKMLYSETANQYRSAYDLFRLTAKRLERILDVAKKAEKKALPGDAVIFQEQILLAQTSLYQLGKEALSENAEWLILHRTRPLEFPMAG